MNKGRYTYTYTGSNILIYNSKEDTDEIDTFDTINEIIIQVKKEYHLTNEDIFISFNTLQTI